MSIMHQMYQCRMNGMRYAAIARRFGLTLERCYALVKDFERACLFRLRQSFSAA